MRLVTDACPWGHPCVQADLGRNVYPCGGCPTSSREEQDAYATESYRRAAEASSAGRFKDEIAPVTVEQRGRSISSGFQQTMASPHYMKRQTWVLHQCVLAF